MRKYEFAPVCYRLPYDVLWTTLSSCTESDNLYRGLHTPVSPYVPIMGICFNVMGSVTLLIEESSSNGINTLNKC
jgi:hypothetical protein